ncbi:phenylalanine--tRNA ligase subunit beta [Phycisphaera mikurensis]|uniref:Phenylalanine--tRNA ligase beta subunit n=1 Tax=Phycisphaera mikurensis (strain NBRC 102666 / KCTC 22515 / FYK2301M01) TaxID=1142394 RepID=I0IG68_PHYMF|nr:phenylalanine--tRNA ligase subunit beta [Phycisphaera mikurensis]MBB6440361.1 phenylalanyl-tRNA synthetase beta chain [Phycisphaera mikurensis]BAM04256.1 phenylalanyl-tRNA synthetase beta chain [Phycisphaera mikurensis NBRC 102666]
MNASLAWLNRHLDRPVTADEAAEALTRVGFPVEGRWEAGDDTGLDVEVTSNRGDCLSHRGLARELCAATGRSLVPPRWPVDAAAPAGEAASVRVSIDAAADRACPRYLGFVVRGVKVGPSPAWLVDLLEAVKLRPVNNVVDATNLVLMDTGQPTHAFDLAAIAGGRVEARFAREGETLEAINHETYALQPSMLVIADGQRPQALAGVMGGAGSEVTADTTEVFLEVAAFDALTTRRTARALKLTSDASHRYERGTDLAAMEAVGRRLAGLVASLAGGTAAPGFAEAGGGVPARAPVAWRPARCSALLGIDVPMDRQVAHLRKLGLEVLPGEGPRREAEVPGWRNDLQREVDLVEEVARLEGLDDLPVRDRLEVSVRPPHPRLAAGRTLAEVLVAGGGHEAMCFAWATWEDATALGHREDELVRVDDDRSTAAPFLRPSLLPSLLAVRKRNQDAGNADPRSFEFAATWTRRGAEATERRQLGMVIDAPEPERDLRSLRGLVAEAAARLGVDAPEAVPDAEPAAGFAASAGLLWGGEAGGRLGLLSPSLQKRFGLACPVAAMEFPLDRLLGPQRRPAESSPLPRFPSTERDLSIVVDEETPWASVAAAVAEASPERMESLACVGVYRGKPLEPGTKSVTLRMVFRDAEKTLTREEVEPAVAAVVRTLERKTGGRLRA